MLETRSSSLSTAGLAAVGLALLALGLAPEALSAQRTPTGRSDGARPQTSAHAGGHHGYGFGPGFGKHGTHRNFSVFPGGHFPGGFSRGFAFGFDSRDFALMFGDGFFGRSLRPRGFSGGFGSRYGYAPYWLAYSYGPGARSYERDWSYPIRRYSEPAPSPLDARSRDRELDLRAEPARLAIALAPTRAEVYLDGTLVGTAAELRGRTLIVEPGEHLLETKHPTFQNRTIQITAAAGETQEIE